MEPENTLGGLAKRAMNRAEQVAQAVVEAVEVGATMRPKSEQSHGEHDFDLHYPDGRIATLEVTAAMDENAERTIAALRDNRKGGPFAKRAPGRQGWYIHPGRNANINRVRSQADAYLARVEADGLTKFFSSTDAADYDSVRQIWNDLQIVGGTVFQWKTPETIGISAPGGGGAVSVSAFLRAVSTEANKPDNLRKLREAGTEERHLFVYIDMLNFLPWVAFVDSDPPADAQDPPDGITHVWAAAEGRSINEFVVWLMKCGDAWRNVGPLTLVMGRA